MEPLYPAGKFPKPPRKRHSTPYDRPPPPTQSQDGGGSWLSKLVVNPARRLIVGGATRILPSFFSQSHHSSSSSEYDSEDADADAIVNVGDAAEHTLELVVSGSSKNAGPSNETDKLKGIVEHVDVQQDKSEKVVEDLGVDQIENMLKGKHFSRDESMRLLEILNSRLADDSKVEGGEKPATVVPQAQNKGNALDHEILSTSNIRKHDFETPMPRLQSNIQDEVAASPIDIAKAYMGSRVSELGFNTYSNVSIVAREQKSSDAFPSKPHFFTPSSKSSTCWPGAMVQDQRSYLTPQNQRSRYGLHNFPRTPYSRTKPRLSQLQGDGKSSNTSLTTFQQSRLQTKTSSDAMDVGYGSVGPIRRVKNKLVTEPQSEGPKSFSSARIASSSSASRSSVPVFQKNTRTSGTSNFYTADKNEQSFKGDANTNSAGPSNETVRKILEQLDRHKPTPKEKAAELKLATDWKRLPSQDTNLSGPGLHRSGVSSDSRYFKGPDGGVSFRDQVKTSNADTKRSASVNDAAAPGPVFGFTNMGAANEKSTAPDTHEKEKSQPWAFDNKVNGQDLTKKRPSQPILKPITFKRPDPQQVVSSDNGRGFTFPFSGTSSSASEPPTPSIMPSFPPPAPPQSKESPVIPTYSFGTNQSERIVFNFPSTRSAADDGVSDIKFNFGSDKKRVSFGLIGSDAIVIN
ncbi:nuclear pore complex protein NUP1-like [Bidens hawaiensis]|uniref:nuclear pore complex protein NUP1-like n=1 Tax=Bidens hawaiensis TaxID=980011 RepID=UPI00404B2B30